MSNICGDDCSPPTSGRVASSTSSTSPTCGSPQGNARVSSVGHCNDDNVLVLDDPSSLSYCNGPSLDLNTSSTLDGSYASVDSPCISCRNCLTKSHDDMLAMSCCHDKNASISSSCCANNVEETQHSMEQDVVLYDASRDPISSSIAFCLMAKASKVSPASNPDISCDDDVDDDKDDADEENDEENDNVASLKIKGEMIFKALHKNKIARSNFMEIMSIAIEGKKYIEELESHLEEHEVPIDNMEGHEHDYANEIADLSQALELEQTTKESLRRLLL